MPLCPNSLLMAWLPRGVPAGLVPNLANAYSCIGLALLVYGLVTLDVWMTIAGIVIVHGGKLWYLDRMVLLFEDMKQRDANVAGWEYGT